MKAEPRPTMYRPDSPSSFDRMAAIIERCLIDEPSRTGTWLGWSESMFARVALDAILTDEGREAMNELLEGTT